MTDQSNNEFHQENEKLRLRLEDSERYSRRDNLVFYGLKCNSYAESASGSGPPGSSLQQDSGSDLLPETSLSTEQSVVAFCNDVLKVNITSADITAAHRLPVRKRRPGSSQSSAQDTASSVMVRFTNRRSRDAVFAAR